MGVFGVTEGLRPGRGSTVAVVGAGRMGSQIAVEFASCGFDTFVVSRSAEGARGRVDAAFDLLARVSKSSLVCSTARESLSYAPTLAQVPNVTELVIESIPEDLDLKKAVIADIGEHLPDAVIASNTSSFRIGALGEVPPLSSRLVGMHYWFPPLLMELIEIVPARAEPWAYERALEFARRLGRKPIVVERDVPGFVWNRLQFALLREAHSLVRSGVATLSDVDVVVRDGLARRLLFTGPFETVAVGGAAAWEQIAANLLPTLSSEPDVVGLGAMVAGLSERADEIVQHRDAGLASWFPRDASVRDLLPGAGEDD